MKARHDSFTGKKLPRNFKQSTANSGAPNQTAKADYKNNPYQLHQTSSLELEKERESIHTREPPSTSLSGVHKIDETSSKEEELQMDTEIQSHQRLSPRNDTQEINLIESAGRTAPFPQYTGRTKNEKPKLFNQMTDFIPEKTVSGVGHSTLQQSHAEHYGIGTSRERA